jgi:hypothetical protein
MPQLESVSIFLASPGDVAAERRSAEAVVSELNRTVAAAHGVVMQLVRWETDTIPAYGDDPQALVNRQIAEMSGFDLFVGILWNRIGTQTPRAESGTVEEFELAADAHAQLGRPQIWLYFRNAPATLNTDEQVEQRRKVIEFKNKLRAQALVSEYRRPSNFRDQFRTHLTQWLTRREDKTPRPTSARNSRDLSIDSTAEDGVSAISTQVAVEPSVELLIATVKHYLGDDRYRIPLHDLVDREVAAAQALIDSPSFQPPNTANAETYTTRLNEYLAAFERVLAILAVLAYHGRDQQGENIARAVRRIARTSLGSGLVIWLNLRSYPALLAAYTVGVLSLPTRQYRHLAAVLLTRLFDARINADQPLVLQIPTSRVLSEARILPGGGQLHTPWSDFLAGQLKKVVRDYFVTDEEFEEAFDAFEYFLSVVYLSEEPRHERGHVGSFAWRQYGALAARPEGVIGGVQSTLTTDARPLVQAGFFREGLDVVETIRAHNEFMQRVRQQIY